MTVRGGLTVIKESKEVRIERSTTLTENDDRNKTRRKEYGGEGIYKRPKDREEEMVIKLDQRTNERGDRNGNKRSQIIDTV